MRRLKQIKRDYMAGAIDGLMFETLVNEHYKRLKDDFFTGVAIKARQELSEADLHRLFGNVYLKKYLNYRRQYGIRIFDDAEVVHKKRIEFMFHRYCLFIVFGRTRKTIAYRKDIDANKNPYPNKTWKR